MRRFILFFLLLHPVTLHAVDKAPFLFQWETGIFETSGLTTSDYITVSQILTPLLFMKDGASMHIIDATTTQEFIRINLTTTDFTMTVIGDINNNGFSDLFFAEFDGLNVRYTIYDLTNYFATLQPTYEFSDGFLQNVVVVGSMDINADGFSELMVADFTGPSVTYLAFNITDGSIPWSVDLGDRVPLPNTLNFEPPDLDGDDVGDVILTLVDTGFTAQSLLVLSGATGDTLLSLEQAGVDYSLASLTDIDGDGRVEAVIYESLDSVRYRVLVYGTAGASPKPVSRRFSDPVKLIKPGEKTIPETRPIDRYRGLSRTEHLQQLRRDASAPNPYRKPWTREAYRVLRKPAAITQLDIEYQSPIFSKEGPNRANFEIDNIITGPILLLKDNQVLHAIDGQTYSEKFSTDLGSNDWTLYEVGDLNGNGTFDLAVVEFRGGATQLRGIEFNDGKQIFNLGGDAGGFIPNLLFHGTVNADTDPVWELVLTEFTPDGNQTYGVWDQEEGRFLWSTTFVTELIPFTTLNMIATDLNGDGFGDLLVPHFGAQGFVRYLVLSGADGDTSLHLTTPGTNNILRVAQDIDLDGRIDLGVFQQFQPTLYRFAVYTSEAGDPPAPPTAVNAVDHPGDTGGAIDIHFIASPNHPGAAAAPANATPISAYNILRHSLPDPDSAAVWQSVNVGALTLGDGDSLVVTLDTGTDVAQYYYWIQSVAGNSVSDLAGPNAARPINNTAAGQGDVNGNNVVDIGDVALLAEIFGITEEYDPALDLNANGVIDIADVSIVAQVFGQSVP